jgi:hypothetical protein
MPQISGALLQKQPLTSIYLLNTQPLAFYHVKLGTLLKPVFLTYVYGAAPCTYTFPHPPNQNPEFIRDTFMGFTKSRSLIRWLDPSTNTIKHTTAARFDEYRTLLSSTNTLPPGSLLLHNNPSDKVSLPETTADITAIQL